MDIDPATLAAGAAASAHAYEQAVIHIEEEVKARDPSRLDALVGSLAAEGPYAYSILPRVGADGAIGLPVLTTREEIAEAYAFIRGLSDLHEVVGLTEVRGTWYLFQDALTRSGPKGSDVVNDRQTLGLFPSGSAPGITGELVWLRVPRAQLGFPDDVEVVAEDDLHGRKLVFDQHARYLDGLRANDVDAILAALHDGAASAVRDYVADTGTLVELTGKDAHRDWYRALLDRYEVRSVDALHVVIEEWYVFAELRVVVAPRSGGGPLAFHTAEFHIPARDGRFIARIGHGTAPAPVPAPDR